MAHATTCIDLKCIMLGGRSPCRIVYTDGCISVKFRTDQANLLWRKSEQYLPLGGVQDWEGSEGFSRAIEVFYILIRMWVTQCVHRSTHQSGHFTVFRSNLNLKKIVYRNLLAFLRSSCVTILFFRAKNTAVSNTVEVGGGGRTKRKVSWKKNIGGLRPERQVDLLCTEAWKSIWEEKKNTQTGQCCWSVS